MVNQISTSTCTRATTPGAAQQLHNGYEGPASIEDFGQLVPACLEPECSCDRNWLTGIDEMVKTSLSIQLQGKCS